MLMCLNFFGYISSYIEKKATLAFIYYFLKFSYNHFNQTGFLFIFSTLSQSLQLYSLVSLSLSSAFILPNTQFSMIGKVNPYTIDSVPKPSLQPLFESPIAIHLLPLVQPPSQQLNKSLQSTTFNTYIMGFLKNEIKNRRFWRRVRRDQESLSWE